MTLLDEIQHAIALGMKVSFSRELSNCKIDVEKDGKVISQMLPLDDHMDYALPGCIKFCINKAI